MIKRHLTETISGDLLERIYDCLDNENNPGQINLKIGIDVFLDYHLGDLITFQDLENLRPPLDVLVIAERDNSDNSLGAATRIVKVDLLVDEFDAEDLNVSMNTGKAHDGINIKDDNSLNDPANFPSWQGNVPVGNELNIPSMTASLASIFDRS
jgi:hypothetical protein